MAPLKDLADDHELGHLRSALKHFDERRLAVDGGAHRGIWTRELVKHFDLVWAFEPRLEFATRIEDGHVMPYALGERHGFCSIREGTQNTGQAHVAPGDDVCVVALDSFRFEVLDFLKLDLEGYELHALKGGEQTILSCRPAIMVEMNGLSERYGYNDKDLHAWLSERGYKHIGRWGRNHLYQ